MSQDPATHSERHDESPPLHLPSSIWFAALAAFLLRVSLCVLSHRLDSVHPVRQVVGQEAGYIAWSLHIGKGFSTPFPGYERPTAWLAPVFPAMWSVSFMLFDPFRTQGHIYFAQFLNSAFAALMCFSIYRLGINFEDRRVGLVAAWVWVFLPLAILFPLEWAWDQSLSALLLAWLLCMTYDLSRSPARSWAWPRYGLLWGFSALTNPSLCIMLPVLLAWIYFRRSRLGTQSLAQVFAVLLVFAISLTPWTMRNYKLLGHIVFVKSNFGAELWLGNNPAVKNVVTGWLHPIENHEELESLNEEGEYGYMQEKQKAAIAYIRAKPGLFAEHVSLRVLDTWTGIYYFNDDPWVRSLRLRKAFIAFTALFSFASLVGLIFMARKDFAKFAPLILCCVILPIPFYITHSTLRYRHPIDPILTIMAVLPFLLWRALGLRIKHFLAMVRELKEKSVR